MADYALLGAKNYYTTRRFGAPIFCVQHITAGLSDYIAPDMSADNTQNWGKNPASDVSWHDICDSDSAIPCLPGSYTAWHAANYNSRSIGQEIGTGSTDWSTKSPAWVEATLKNSAKLWAPHVKKYNIPLVKVTKAQVDAELAKGANAKPLGFIGHGDLDPRNRTDPGLYKGKDTFPWQRLFELIRIELGQKPPTVAPPTKNTAWTPLVVDGIFGKATITAWQRYNGTVQDGDVSPEYSSLIAKVQTDLNRVYGISPALSSAKLDWLTETVLMRHYGSLTRKGWVTELQKALNSWGAKL